jgi:hypothetical protein
MAMNKGMGSRRRHGRKVERWGTRREIKALARRARGTMEQRAIAAASDTSVTL